MNSANGSVDAKEIYHAAFVTDLKKSRFAGSQQNGFVEVDVRLFA